MLRFEGVGSTHTCNGVTRRDFLQVGTLAAAGLTLPGLLHAKEQGHLVKQFISWSWLFVPLGAELLSRPFVCLIIAR